MVKRLDDKARLLGSKNTVLNKSARIHYAYHEKGSFAHAIILGKTGMPLTDADGKSLEASFPDVPSSYDDQQIIDELTERLSNVCGGPIAV